MSIRFLDPKTKKIVFKFLKHESPEEFPYHYKLTTNHIEYPDGTQTNQEFGLHFQPIEFSGVFKGTHLVDNKVKSVYDRVEDLKSLLKSKLIVEIPGSDGAYKQVGPGVFLFADLDGMFKKSFTFLYKVTLLPHQEQEVLTGVKSEKITLNPDAFNSAFQKTEHKRSLSKAGKPPIKKLTQQQSKDTKIENPLIPGRQIVKPGGRAIAPGVGVRNSTGGAFR